MMGEGEGGREGGKEGSEFEIGHENRGGEENVIERERET